MLSLVKMKVCGRFFKFLILFSVFLLADSLSANAQIFLLNEMPRGIYYERTARVRKFKDMKDFRDVFHYDKLLLGDDIISGNISYNTGRVILNDEEGKRYVYRHAMGFYTRIRVVEEFFVNTTFFKDFNKEAAPHFMSDYTYSVGRYNWRPRTWSYGYENYQPNKYTDSSKERLEKFLQGNFFVSYGLVLPKLSEIKFKRNKSDTTEVTLDSIAILKKLSKIKLSWFARYAYKYRDREEQLRGGSNLWGGKPMAGVSARYTFWRNFYIEGATNFYLIPVQKQDWDPDFTYGFGYFDYRSFRMSFMYGSYAVNRFPWNGKKAYEDFGFLDGTFRVVANYMW